MRFARAHPPGVPSKSPRQLPQGYAPRAPIGLAFLAHGCGFRNACRQPARHWPKARREGVPRQNVERQGHMTGQGQDQQHYRHGFDIGPHPIARPVKGRKRTHLARNAGTDVINAQNGVENTIKPR